MKDPEPLLFHAEVVLPRRQAGRLRPRGVVRPHARRRGRPGDGRRRRAGRPGVDRRRRVGGRDRREALPGDGVAAAALRPARCSRSRPRLRSMLRVGVAGLGIVAQAVHLPLLARRWDLFEISALCDLSASRCARLGERYGVPASRHYSSVDDMCERAPHRRRARAHLGQPRRRGLEVPRGGAGGPVREAVHLHGRRGRRRDRASGRRAAGAGGLHEAVRRGLRPVA